MPVLHITVRWLASEPGRPSYHGQEWPPSPSRLFRALLAATSRPGGAGQRGREALQRLEAMEPPIILGPAPDRLEPVRTAVPNNDQDRVLALHHKGRPEEARKKASSSRTMRLRQGWSVPSPVEYRWHFPAEDPDPEAFMALSQGVTTLGHGVDLVMVTAHWAEEEPPRWGFIWQPDQAKGAEALPVPTNGEIERLDKAYERSRRRIQGTQVMSTREPLTALANYRNPLAPPPMRWQAFTVRTPDDSAPWATPGEEMMRLSGMVRHAVKRACELAGLDDALARSILGHGDDDHRLYVMPVPNVGHEWADGRVRRVLIASPLSLPEDTWNAVLLRMTGAELVEQGTGELKGLLAHIQRLREDRLLWRFLNASRIWTAASPVVLPGFDSRRGRPRPEKTVRRLLKHAGIPPEAIQRIRLDHAPRLPGVCAAWRTEVPHYLHHYPRKYVTVEFVRPVSGPLFLGAAQGVGLGLLTHGEGLSGALTPGKRSHWNTLRKIRTL